MTDNVDSKGVARYPVGIMPVMDPETGETLGRRTRPPLVHDLGRLWADDRQEHRARLSALGLLPGRPQAQRRIFRRDAIRSKVAAVGYRAALRPGEPEAAELRRRVTKSAAMKAPASRRECRLCRRLCAIVTRAAPTAHKALISSPLRALLCARAATLLAARRPKPVDIELVLAVDVSFPCRRRNWTSSAMAMRPR